ncbi:MAG: O-antigen ligase family protein [Mesonia hippocampi]|uniref:O-antigen ligase family protein n=1 Tax=Mesonia hippocampi TaxID=1628250 RepID=UPI003F994C8B
MKNPKKRKATAKHSKNQEEKVNLFTKHFIPILILSSYFIIETIAIKGQIDYKGFHWLAISVVNLLGLSYIFFNIKQLNLINVVFKKNILLILLAVFFILSGVSILQSINVGQSIVAYAALMPVITMTFVFFCLLYKRIEILKILALVITGVAFYESFDAVSAILGGIADGENYSTLRRATKGTMGNQNVFAFAFVVKFPFVAYAAIVYKQWWVRIVVAVTLFLSFMTISFTGSRAGVLSVIGQSILLLGGLGYLLFKTKEKTRFIYLAASYAFVLVASYFVHRTIHGNNTRKALVNVTAKQKSTFIEGSIAEQGRVKYWKNSFELIKEKPLQGYGFGNYELYIPTYYKTMIDGNRFSRHPHNEFVNIAAESGIINSLVFLGIFIASLLLIIKILRDKENNYPDNVKIVAVIGFVALAGYFMDCMFNFPINRPPMQIWFGLIIGLIAAVYLSYQKKLSEESLIEKQPVGLVKLLAVSLLILGLIVTVINYNTYVSYKIQGRMIADLSAVNKRQQQNLSKPENKRIPVKPTYNYDNLVKELPKIPNLAEDTEPIGYKLSRYLLLEKRYVEAVKVLDSIHQYSPYTGYDYYLKSNAYDKMNKPDSAYKYAKKAYYNRPRNLSYYKTAMAMAQRTGHVEDLKPMFEEFSKYSPQAEVHITYIYSLIRAKENTTLIMSETQKAAELYPEDTKIQNLNAKLHSLQNRR